MSDAKPSGGKILTKPFMILSLIFVVAGIRVEREFLTRLVRDTGLTVELVYPDGLLTSDPNVSHAPVTAGRTTQDGSTAPETDAASQTQKTSGGDVIDTIVREMEVPFIDSQRGRLTVAKFRVTHRLDDLRELRRSIDRWFLVTVAAAVLLVIILVSWTASRISRPLVELADKTSCIDLDSLDVSSGEDDLLDEVTTADVDDAPVG